MKASPLVYFMLCSGLCAANQFSIVLKSAGSNTTYCLDLFGQNTKNGSPIDIWECSESQISGQTWIFDKGSYKIRSSVNYSKCAGINGTKLVIEDCASSPSQSFGWDPTGLLFAYNGSDVPSKCLRVDAPIAKGNSVYLGSCVNASSWYAMEGPAPGPYPDNAVFNFKNIKLRSCVGLPPNSTAESVKDGTLLSLYTCSNASNDKTQQWIFAAGSYRIRSALAPNMCIDATERMAGDLILWHCNGFPQQQWTFDVKALTIGLSGQEGKCMDFAGPKRVVVGQCGEGGWNLIHVIHNKTATVDLVMI